MNLGQASITQNRRNHNKETEASYLDQSINPLTKGKRLASPEYVKERFTSVIDSMEPLNYMSKGKKLTSPHTPDLSNKSYGLFQDESFTGKGKSIYSYRTFASQIRF